MKTRIYAAPAVKGLRVNIQIVYSTVFVESIFIINYTVPDYSPNLS